MNLQSKTTTPTEVVDYVIPLADGKFIAVMTDLCMVTMFSYLSIKECVRMMSVSRHAYRSVLHSAVWRGITFSTPSYESASQVATSLYILKIDGDSIGTQSSFNTPTIIGIKKVTHAESITIRNHCAKILSDATRLPSTQMCALIGGIRLSSRELQLIRSFPSIKRLFLVDEPLLQQQEVNSDIQSESKLLSALRLEHLSLYLDYSSSSQRFDDADQPRSVHAFHGISTRPSWAFLKKATELESSHEVASYNNSLLPPPLIFTYIDSLRRLHLTIEWGPGSRILDSISSRVWSQLDTLKLEYRTCRSVPGARITDELPFEDLLMRSRIALPKLTSLDLSMHDLTHIDPTSSLIRIFNALDEASTLLSLRVACSGLVTKKYPQISTYPRSLTSLELQLGLNAGLHSLSVTPRQLFESIGHSVMPHLSRLTSECHMYRYASVEEFKIERAHVCQLMSEMSALTELYISYCDLLITADSKCFFWLDHASLFSSLKRVEYQLGGQPLNMLQPIHTSAGAGPQIPSPRLYNCEHPLLPHLASPIWRYSPRTYTEGNITSTVINIAAQSEYEWSSPDEIRILQQHQFEMNNNNNNNNNNSLQIQPNRSSSALPSPSSLFVHDESANRSSSSYDLLTLHAPISPSIMFPTLTTKIPTSAASANGRTFNSFSVDFASATPFVFQFGSSPTASTSTIATLAPTSFTAVSSSSSSSPLTLSAFSRFAATLSSSSPSISSFSSTSTFASTSTSSPFTFESLYSSTLPSSSPSVIAAASSSSSLSSPHSSNPTPTSPFVFQFGSKPTSTVAPTSSSASSTITSSLPFTFGSAFSTSASMPSLSSSSSSSFSSSSSLSSGFVFQFGSK